MTAGSTRAHAVAVMAKASQAGRTKTRLSPPLTPEEAASFNTAFLKDMAAIVARSGQDRSVAAYMAYGPPGSKAFFHDELPDAGLIEVWLPNFGDCLWTAIEEMFARGHRTACVLNSDSPTLPVSFLTDMYDALEAPGDRAVLGPSTDGGYYLLGLKARHRRLFEDIAWSTEDVARQTRERASEIGLELVELPVWYDVDDAESLRRLVGERFLQARFSDHLSSPAPASTARLLSLFEDADGLRRLGLSMLREATG